MSFRCAMVLGFTGGVVVVAGILLPTVFNIVLKDEMEKMLPLVNGSYAYEKWRHLPVPMFMQIWVFDVVNADEVIENGVKPYVVEKGPYTYRLRKEKINITDNANLTLTYRQLTWYYFDRDMSVGEENDTFTTINNILLGTTYMTRFEYPYIKEMTNLLLDTLGGRLYKTYAVRDIVWGYEDPLLKIVKDDILGLFNMSDLFDDHFGFFYKWNGSDDGQFTIFTGKQDLTKLNQVNTFNGLGYSPFWSTTYARMINGTDGTFFPPFLEKKKPLYFYSPETCRSLHVEYSEDKSVKGMDAYRFILPTSILESGRINSNNVGFCTPDVRHCMPSGVLNVSGCRDASSAIMSFPHFFGGDPEVINGVQGLEPDPQQHASYLDLEPISAVPLDVQMRLQISVYVSEFANIKQLRNTRSYFHPVFWFNETASLTDELADQLRSELILVVHVVAVLKYLLPCVGSVSVVSAAAYIICVRKNGRNKKKKTGDSETSPLVSENTSREE